RDDGYVYAELAVRKVLVADPSQLELELTRSYVGCTGGTETVELYDWSTWSYPYGSFIAVASTPITGTGTQSLSIPVSGDPARFLDGEGTAYLRITATNAVAGAELRADGLRLRFR